MIVPTSPYAANTLHYPALELLLPFRKEKPQKNITTRQTMRKSQIIYKILAFFGTLQRTQVTSHQRHRIPRCVKVSAEELGTWLLLPTRLWENEGPPEQSWGASCGLLINQQLISFLSLRTKSTLPSLLCEVGGWTLHIRTCPLPAGTIWSCASRGWRRDIKMRMCNLNESPEAASAALLLRPRCVSSVQMGQHKWHPAHLGHFAVSFKTLLQEFRIR